MVSQKYQIKLFFFFFGGGDKKKKAFLTLTVKLYFNPFQGVYHL